MAIAIVTGSCGLIGSEAVEFLEKKGMDVIGVDNDMRKFFFGEEASTRWRLRELQARVSTYSHYDFDIRDMGAITKLFQHHGREIRVIIHTAAQPSHDWASRDPSTDFGVNAGGTVNLLEATRVYCPHAAFIFTSTNKVYGDFPNGLPLVEYDTRWDLPSDHPLSLNGIDESMSIDATTHSIMGASKVAADIMVQEYGRYYGLHTACFRGGCLTGPAHSGAMLHGFLSYLVHCSVAQESYTAFGYKGKQVRDNMHSRDVIEAFWEFIMAPRAGAVYNIGGGRSCSCSIQEAFEICSQLLRRECRYVHSPSARKGDHKWWITDTRRFERDYPNWKRSYTLKRIIEELLYANKARFA